MANLSSHLLWNEALSVEPDFEVALSCDEGIVAPLW